MTWKNAGGQGRDRTGDLPLFRWNELRHNSIRAGHCGSTTSVRTGRSTWSSPLAPSWPHEPAPIRCARTPPVGDPPPTHRPPNHSSAQTSTGRPRAPQRPVWGPSRQDRASRLPQNAGQHSSVIAAARLGPTLDAEQHSARHQEVGRLGHDIEPRRRARAAACAQDQPGGVVPVGLVTNCQVPGQDVASSVTWWHSRRA